MTSRFTLDGSPELEQHLSALCQRVGERIRADFQSSGRQEWAEEAFEIKVRNRKSEPVTVRVVEHLYRWSNWRIVQQSQDFTKKDAQTIEFQVPVPADTERTVTYRVRYERK